LIGSSFASLPVNTWGLDYAGISKTIDSTPLTSGIHFLGVMHSFIIYETTRITWKFNGATTIVARTADGLTVSFDAIIEY